MEYTRRIGLRSRPKLGSVVDASSATYLALMAYLVLVRLAISVFPATFRSAAQAAVFDWPFIAVYTVAGFAGLWFARRSGFSGAWDARVTHWQRFLLPIALGGVLGFLFVLIDLQTGFTAVQAQQHGLPRENIDMPAAALIYPGGAVIVEVIYRLLLVPLLLWLISRVMLRGRGEPAVFWALAIATSLIEPLSQDLDMAQFGLGLMVAVFGLDFALNLGQATLFRKYGFLAAIVMRVAFYVVWHMLYVH